MNCENISSKIEENKSKKIKLTFLCSIVQKFYR